MVNSDSRKQQFDKSLQYSLVDGSAHSAMLGLTQDYIVPFALVLKATTAQVSLLSSIPNFIMALSQLIAPRIVEKVGSRKGLILPAVFIHALLWLPIMFIPYLFPEQEIGWLVGFVTLSTVFGSLGNPAWGSLMTDLVPEGMRGRYFGLRGRICGFVALVFFFIGGVILQYFRTNPFLGFSIIFGIAMLFRLVSWCFLSKMQEPSFNNPRQGRLELTAILKEIWTSGLGRFIVFVSLMNFATNLAGPFFAVYMIRDLKLDYLTYFAITAVATAINLVFLTFWGRRADKVGNMKVLKITSVLIPLVPLLWTVSHQLYFLIPVQVLSGFAWAGFNLTSTNFLYEASAPEKRIQYIAVFNAMNASAVCLGALAGGYLVLKLPALFGFNLLTLFLLSGLLRGLVVVFLLRRISEVRKVPEVGIAELLFGELNFNVAEKRRNISQSRLYTLYRIITKKRFVVTGIELIRKYELTSANRSPPFKSRSKS